jgi:hypothetical protein
VQDILTRRLEDIPPEQAMLLLALMTGAGVLYCFLGYRLLKLVIGLTGFLLAGSTAAFIVGVLSYGHLMGMGAGLLIGGICGAMALFFLYKTGVFCLGTLGATLVAYNVLQGREEAWILWAVAGLGLVGGFLALLIERPVMTLATAAIGAMLLTQSALAFARDQGWLERIPAGTAQLGEALPPLPYLSWGVFATWALLAGLGAYVQFTSGRAKAPGT